VGQCLVYERTRSLFAVIAIHATFNTVAMVGVATGPAIALGALVVLACVAVPGRLRASPAPLPA
jgi:membrane protease YdiL (CAAX protease family)